MTTTTLSHVTINHGNTVLEKSQLSAAAETVNMAVSTLISAHSQLKSKNITKNVKDNAQLYLKTPETGPSDAEVWGLMAIFTNTLNGLSANRKINVKEMPGAYGSVGFQQIESDEVPTQKGLGKTVARRLGHDDLVARSDINIAISTLSKGVILRVQTLIHEATHRYANTRDHGSKGYTNAAGTRYLASGLTREEAIINADSVAWMAVHIAKPYCSWLK